ncbi:hypothetical protein Tco_1064408 [Tanacetum coccineum]
MRTRSQTRNRPQQQVPPNIEPFNLEEPIENQAPPVVTKADQHTTAELLCAPTEGYVEAIVDRYKDLLRACPHYGFTELHQLDTFYNALNPADQDSLNSAAGVNSSDVNSSSSSEIAKLTHAVNQQTSVVTTAMTAILKQFQAIPPPAFVKAVEEICVTCGGAYPNTVANPKGELKAITTRSGLVLDGPFVPMPSPFINPEEDERVEETLTNMELAEYTIKVPPPLV